MSARRSRERYPLLEISVANISVPRDGLAALHEAAHVQNVVMPGFDDRHTHSSRASTRPTLQCTSAVAEQPTRADVLARTGRNRPV
jgi:hypothetical protein